MGSHRPVRSRSVRGSAVNRRHAPVVPERLHACHGLHSRAGRWSSSCSSCSITSSIQAEPHLEWTRATTSRVRPDATPAGSPSRRGTRQYRLAEPTRLPGAAVWSVRGTVLLEGSRASPKCIGGDRERLQSGRLAAVHFRTAIVPLHIGGLRISCRPLPSPWRGAASGVIKMTSEKGRGPSTHPRYQRGGRTGPQYYIEVRNHKPASSGIAPSTARPTEAGRVHLRRDPPALVALSEPVLPLSCAAHRRVLSGQRTRAGAGWR